MTLIDNMFRRVAATDAVIVRAQPAPKPKTTKKQSGGFYYWNFFIHKWAGLVGAVWLAVLGLTGFFLDHDSWRWLQQGKAPAFLTPAALDAASARGVARILQIDPGDRANEVAAGPRGLWFSRDGGQNWTAARFAKGDHPMILAVEPDPVAGWGRLWLATDDGVWLSQDKGETAAPATLAGDYVTALAAGNGRGEMLAVIDRSKIMRFSGDDPAAVSELALKPLSPEARPTEVPLVRFVRELHFGKGVADQLTSLVLNDVGGLGMFVLSVTGLLYWGLPKWWKHKSKSAGAADKATKAARRSTIVWLFRLHSATIGIASALMLLYLAITGVFIGHGRELGDWMRRTQLPQSVLPPAFSGASWNGWVDAIVAWPGQSGAYTIGNRYGMFTTVDDGESWAREEDPKGQPLTYAGRLRRIGDKVLLSGGMAGPSFIRGVDQIDHEVKVEPGERRHRAGDGGPRDGAGRAEAGRGGLDHARHGGGAPAGNAPGAGARAGQFGGMNGMEGMFMPSDVTALGADRYAWKSSGKLFVTDADGREIEKLDIAQPSDPGTPWYSWLLRVHTGTIFWSEWKWVNDFFAISAVFLSVTGLVRWWRQKWM